MKVAIIGATGLVGRKMIQILEERQFPVSEIIPVASLKSINKKIFFNKKEYKVVSIDDAINMKPNIAIFSAGSIISLEYAPKFAEIGTFVIDNSSAWRMDNTKKLIVPEINASELTKEDTIIANPNCSTIQMVMALAPLHKKYKIKRIIVSTYQSITGSGMQAVNQMKAERSKLGTEKLYPHQIDLNVIPHCDIFLDNDYTKEEMKLVYETQKIFNNSSIQVSATAARVPVIGGHSESVNVEFKNKFEIDDVKNVLRRTKGVVVVDNPSENEYPMPITSHNKDDVFVGRIRKDLFLENALNMWIVADNIRKGAATNTVQIAEYISKFIKI